MVQKKFGLMIILTIFFVFSFSVASATSVLSCQSINSSGTYVLQNDIGSNRSCITIRADDIVLDCQGYTINHSQSGAGTFGIWNDVAVDNLTIKNCKIVEGNPSNQYGYAIGLLENVSNITIDNNEIITYGNFSSGAYLYDIDDYIIKDNIITTNGRFSYGLEIYGSDSRSLIYGNIITTSGYHADGVNLHGSNDSVITQNTIRTVHLDACVIHIQLLAHNNTFYNNIFNTSNITSSGFCLDDEPLLNIWNTTKAAGTNIIGRASLGGNFWTNNASIGYSDTCIDSDKDDFCDEQYNISSDFLNVDYLPLSDEAVASTPPPSSGGGVGGDECEWNCTEWSNCSVLRYQTRTCTPIKRYCTDDKPEERKDCEYIISEEIEKQVEATKQSKGTSGKYGLLYALIAIIIIGTIIALVFRQIRLKHLAKEEKLKDKHLISPKEKKMKEPHILSRLLKRIKIRK